MSFASLLGECSIPNALNLKELGVETHNCAHLSDFLALFCYAARMPLFSRISPDIAKLNSVTYHDFKKLF